MGKAVSHEKSSRRARIRDLTPESAAGARTWVHTAYPVELIDSVGCALRRSGSAAWPHVLRAASSSSTLYHPHGGSRLSRSTRSSGVWHLH